MNLHEPECPSTLPISLSNVKGALQRPKGRTLNCHKLPLVIKAVLGLALGVRGPASTHYVGPEWRTRMTLPQRQGPHQCVGVGRGHFIKGSEIYTKPPVLFQLFGDHDNWRGPGAHGGFNEPSLLHFSDGFVCHSLLG